MIRKLFRLIMGEPIQDQRMLGKGMVLVSGNIYEQSMKQQALNMKLIGALREVIEMHERDPDSKMIIADVLNRHHIRVQSVDGKRYLS